ncbi:MAG: pantoate--beta-alanine ligase [Rhodobacteraceae bacterium]|nr:pantoate--beta-alanine ligase [Paracoccaceae bacterium]
MQICRTIAQIRHAVDGFRAADENVALVTTMGALHAGHMALMAEANGARDRVVATLFVNPTQFGNPDDLASYPRDEARDLAMLETAGIDAVFIPDASEIYPEGDETFVETARLAGLFHGAVRPGHFRGVATVVCKLFNIIQADTAFFGEKDYQQLAVIRRMTRDLHMQIDIRGVATLREPDGLAMSSRNVKLMPDDRAAAPVLNRALNAAQKAMDRQTQAEDLISVIRAIITMEPRATLRALDIVDAASFTPATGPITAPIGIMVSAKFGDVLLIDQREITP